MANDNWRTPDHILQTARDMFSMIGALDKRGRIDLDAASDKVANKRVNAARYYTQEINALDEALRWRAKSLWLNPPYSRGLISAFADRFIMEVGRSIFEHGLMLVNVDTSAAWWQRLAYNFPMVLFKQRLAFIDPITDRPTRGNRFQQSIFYAGNRPDQFCAWFAPYGLFYRSAESQDRGNQ